MQEHSPYRPNLAVGGPADQGWAIVAFEHREPRFPLNGLKEGYHHCLCLIGSGDGWIMVDPLKKSLHIERISSFKLDFIVSKLYLSAESVLYGKRVINNSPGYELRLLTCVETVKRAIGVDGSWIVTPWQLFRRLTERYGFVQLVPPVVDASLRMSLTTLRDKNIFHQ